MASTFKLQVPADIHSLVQLLAKLGMVCGPMKSAKITNDVVNIWFVPTNGTADVKRVWAVLINGISCVSEGSPRRVYLDVKVQNSAGEWRIITDTDYIAAGLEPPCKYDGACHIGVWLDRPRREGRYEDCGGNWVVNATESIPYHRFIEGDRDRAIAEATALVDECERDDE